MSLSNIVFPGSLPSLDLHGFDRESARVAVNDFIKESLKLQREHVLIIHGRGTGILRQMVHQTLRENRMVEEFQLDFFNPGSTIVKIRLPKKI